MAAKTDKTKLASAIMSVGQERASGVTRGGTVNVPKPVEAPVPSVVADVPPQAQEPAPAPVAKVEGQGGDGKENRTARVGFLCTPKEKRHLKQLALDKDTDVSKLIYDALVAKGYLES